MIENEINISQALGNRFDVSFYNARFDFVSNLYPSFDLGQLVYINPPVSFDGISDNEEMSFIPMESIDEHNGTIKTLKTIRFREIKGFTKFQEGDLLWAKITPCMQNGKSAIACKLKNGFGCGSTEFFVLRPKSDNILIEYIHYILRDKRVLKSAQNSFGGSAGQQRVSSSYLKSVKIPLLPIDIQKQIIKQYIQAQEAKQKKDEEAKSYLEGIDIYLMEVLDIELSQNHTIDKIIIKKISDMIGNRLDVSFYKERFEMMSRIYPNKKLLSVVEIDPTIKFSQDPNTEISFVPMECIDEKFGEIFDIRTTMASKAKGYTKFEEGDLLWAKITPCMQNGKSAIAKNLKNGVGCGSTEFYVMRPKNRDVLIEYVYMILRHKGVLDAAQNSFGGSAGQQRVSRQYLNSIIIPLPLLEKQQEIVNNINTMKQQAKQLQEEGTKLLEDTKHKIEQIILGIL